MSLDYLGAASEPAQPGEQARGRNLGHLKQAWIAMLTREHGWPHDKARVLAESVCGEFAPSVIITPTQPTNRKERS